MILRTVGCRWNRCTMCGYAGEGAPASADDLIIQFESAMEKCSPEVTVVKIYTSGSFLDSEEMPAGARIEILRRLENAGIEKLIIETRPEYVTPAGVEECLSHLQTEFAMGLESANDLIREHLIRKGFLFQDFVRASEMVQTTCSAQFFGPLQDWLGGPDATVRARLLAGFIMGISISRELGGGSFDLEPAECERMRDRLAVILQALIDN